MEEVTFYDFQGAKNFLVKASSDIEINSLIEIEKKEVAANPKLRELLDDNEDLVSFQDFEVPKSAVFVYYPWRNALLITHGQRVFNSIKYVRNSYKISEEEQQLLWSKTIGVVGLSVGCSIVKTIVMEGICGRIKISDFDNLDISNTNRIDWGVFDIGKPKINLLYRWIKESNPFIEVEIFESGVYHENVKYFFQSNSNKLDLIIDECDSLKTKIVLREFAKSLSIPLLMHTSDRGMLDIENYKEEREFVSYLSQFRTLEDEDLKLQAGKIISTFCEIEKASPRSVFSFMEIGKTITSWPQLAEDVISGAGNIANVSRRLLLGEKLASQRAYVSCDNLKYL